MTRSMSPAARASKRSLRRLPFTDPVSRAHRRPRGSSRGGKALEVLLCQDLRGGHQGRLAAGF